MRSPVHQQIVSIRRRGSQIIAPLIHLMAVIAFTQIIHRGVFFRL